MGELARELYNDVRSCTPISTSSRCSGWQRALWFDQTGLPWVRPSPNLPTSPEPRRCCIPRIGCVRGDPTCRSAVARICRSSSSALRGLTAGRSPGCSTIASSRGCISRRQSFTPVHVRQTASTLAGRLGGVHALTITDRRGLHGSARVCASLLWALAKVYPDSFHVDTAAFDLRFGSPAVRRAIMQGRDPDGVMDAELPCGRRLPSSSRVHPIHVLSPVEACGVAFAH